MPHSVDYSLTQRVRFGNLNISDLKEGLRFECAVVACLRELLCAQVRLWVDWVSEGVLLVPI
jgi:hypothetical protein